REEREEGEEREKSERRAREEREKSERRAREEREKERRTRCLPQPCLLAARYTHAPPVASPCAAAARDSHLRLHSHFSHPHRQQACCPLQHSSRRSPTPPHRHSPLA